MDSRIAASPAVFRALSVEEETVRDVRGTLASQPRRVLPVASDLVDAMAAQLEA